MDNDKIVKELKLLPNNLFTVEDVIQVNHYPHPYMIGTKHLVHASENCNGVLGDRTLNTVPCAMHCCNLSHAEHTFDTVVPLKLLRNGTTKEAKDILKSFVDVVEENVDGFIFVETSEQYRITGE